jgi:hypothetical protein
MTKKKIECRKFIAEWGYGVPTGYFKQVELYEEELDKLERAIRYRKITGNDFGSSAIMSIQLENGMRLYAKSSPEYKEALTKIERP